MPPFAFGPAPRAAADEFVARVPAGLTTTEALLDSLFESLRFPDYFGFNWNALFDCLRDFSWLEQRTIVLIHEDLPALPIADLRIYVDLLADAVAGWKPEDHHALRVTFPSSAKAPIEFLLRSASPR